MNKKQVMDIRPNSDGISQAESNEQQRNWSEDFLRKKSNDPMANYDPTRTYLNFEVARSGIVQPIDKSKSIMQMMADNPTLYYRNDECTRFITQVPQTWDETIALEAKAGE